MRFCTFSEGLLRCCRTFTEGLLWRICTFAQGLLGWFAEVVVRVEAADDAFSYVCSPGLHTRAVPLRANLC